MTSIPLLLLLAVAALAAAAAAQAPAPAPGLKVTLSQNGITYGKDWAINKFLPSLQNLHAPDVHGSSGPVPAPPPPPRSICLAPSCVTRRLQVRL